MLKNILKKKPSIFTSYSNQNNYELENLYDAGNAGFYLWLGRHVRSASFAEEDLSLLYHRINGAATDAKGKSHYNKNDICKIRPCVVGFRRLSDGNSYTSLHLSSAFFLCSHLI